MNPWTLLGGAFLLVGGVGMVLPVLPTTPFVLVAAACFARSSPRMHAWLLNSRLFGPVLDDWNRNRCIQRRVRYVALSMMILVGGASVLFWVPDGWPRAAALGFILLGCVTVLALRVCAPPDSRGRST